MNKINHKFPTEILAGLTMAAVVLPQAIAFATTLAGVPPVYGIYCAIWGVLFTAILNPSRSFMGGPNSTMAAVIGVTLLPLAPQFSDAYVGYMLMLVLIAGVIQLVVYAIKPLSRAFDLIPEPVTNGVIMGIGFFLIYKSFAAFSGLPVNTQTYWQIVIAWQTFLSAMEIGNLYAIQVGMIALASGIIARLFRSLHDWYILVALVVGTLYSEFLISIYRNEEILIEQVGNVNLQLFAPSLPTFNQPSMPDIIAMIPGAITLAFIGLFQTVSAMKYFDRRAGEFCDARDGIRSDAVSNCLLPFISSMPTCGSYNRMYLLESLGARSKLAIVIAAFALLIFGVLLVDVLKIIPIPALAAVTMLVGMNMIDWRNVSIHLRSRVETLAFVISFLCIHIFGLFGAVVAGSLVSLAHFLWLKSHPRVWVDGNTVYVTDNVYYGSLSRIEKEISALQAEGYAEVVIDTSNVSYFDDESRRFVRLFIQRGGHVIRRRDPSKDEKDRKG